MSLWRDPYDFSRSSRIMDQRFGLPMDPEDFAPMMTPRELLYLLRGPAGYLRAWRSQASQSDAGSTVCMVKDMFEAKLDVQQFKPEEITVKVADNTVTVEGKHEETEDEHGFVSRHFVRKYVVPKGHDMDNIESKLSSDGVLTIRAPKVDQAKTPQRYIPIVQTGKPSKAVEEKKSKAVEEKKPKEQEPKEERKVVVIEHREKKDAEKK